MYANPKLIKQLSAESGISDPDFDELLSIIGLPPYGELENNNERITIWQLSDLVRSFGCRMEDYFALHPIADGYDDYHAYLKISTLLTEGRVDAAAKLLPGLTCKFHDGTDDKFLIQFVQHSEIKTQDNMPHEEAISRLTEIMKITLPDFHEGNVANIPLTINERNIIVSIAYRYDRLEWADKAINLTLSSIASSEKFVKNETMLHTILTTSYSNLSTMLGRAGRLKECADVCLKGIESGKKASAYRTIALLMYNYACAASDLGKPESVYKPYFIGAYRRALATGQAQVAKIIKKDAAEKGIIID